MFYEEMNDISEKDKAAIKVADNLHEIKDHGNLEFPIAVYTIVLSDLEMQTIRWHWHEEIELIYVKSGTVKVFADDYTTVLKEGQAFFFNQNVLHSLLMIKGQNAIFTSIVFHPALMFGYGKTMLSAKYLTPIIENTHMKYLLIDSYLKESEILTNYMQQLASIYFEKVTGYELLVKSILCYIWYLLLSISHTTLPKVAKTKRIANDEQRIKEAIIYIESHFADPITLDDIADSIHISKSECCRCFKRVLHLTPFEYLIKYRIFYSVKMIQRQDPCAATIADLATSVGFSNISYFNKVFKKYLNITPTEYKLKKKNFTPIMDSIFNMPLKMQRNSNDNH